MWLITSSVWDRCNLCHIEAHFKCKIKGTVKTSKIPPRVFKSNIQGRSLCHHTSPSAWPHFLDNSAHCGNHSRTKCILRRSIDVQIDWTTRCTLCCVAQEATLNGTNSLVWSRNHVSSTSRISEDHIVSVAHIVHYKCTTWVRTNHKINVLTRWID